MLEVPQASTSQKCYKRHCWLRWKRHAYGPRYSPKLWEWERLCSECGWREMRSDSPHYARPRLGHHK